MESAQERALSFAKFWYNGGNQEDAEEDERRVEGLARSICHLLKVQDGFTRHAIRDALTNESTARGSSIIEIEEAADIH